MRNKDLHFRARSVTFGLSYAEYNGLYTAYRKTTCRNFSEYLRKILLEEKITVLQRDQSMDDFMQEMVQLRKELHAIQKNYHLELDKLYTVDQVPEIHAWILRNEADKNAIQDKIAEIKSRINQLADSW